MGMTLVIYKSRDQFGDYIFLIFFLSSAVYLETMDAFLFNKVKKYPSKSPKLMNSLRILVSFSYYFQHDSTTLYEKSYLIF